MKIRIIIILLAIFSLGSAFSQNSFQKDFFNAMQSSQYEEVQKILEKWEKDSPNDIEMYIGYFNYYLQRDVHSNLTLGQMKSGQYGIYNDVQYNMEDVKTGLSYLDKALILAPDRLDVYFGKSSVLMQTENYSELTNTIIEFFNRSSINKNMWLWSNNAPIESLGAKGETVLIDGVKDYLVDMFYQFEGNKSYIKTIIEKTIILYPDNVIGLNLAAYYYMTANEHNKAIEVLLKAHKIDPSDYIIIGNLARAYEITEDYDNARKYYTSLTKLSNADEKARGEEGLKRLEGK